MVDNATMAKISKIHQGKQPVRRHYIAEWLDAKGMTPVDLLNTLNDPERSMDLTEVDKSQVYRWLKGQLPHPSMQGRISGALGFADEPEKILQDPTIDWLYQFFRDKTDEQKEAAITVLKLFFSQMPDDSQEPALDRAKIAEAVKTRISQSDAETQEKATRAVLKIGQMKHNLAKTGSRDNQGKP